MSPQAIPTRPAFFPNHVPTFFSRNQSFPHRRFEATATTSLLHLSRDSYQIGVSPRFEPNATTTLSSPPITIDLCSSDFESDDSDDEEARAHLNKLIYKEENERRKRIRVSDDKADSGEKRQRISEFCGGLGFLTPLVEKESTVETREEVVGSGNGSGVLSSVRSGRQFWKAGDYESGPRSD